MRIIQVLNALDYGDGVCNDALNKYELLKEMGYQTAIYSKFCHPSCMDVWNDISTLDPKDDDIIIHHFCNESLVSDYFINSGCRKILIYHNVTPDSFFSSCNSCSTAMEQLKRDCGKYDVIAGDSGFNIDCLKKLGITGRFFVLPIYIDFQKIRNYVPMKNKDYDRKKIISVGRIVENKRCDALIRVFNEYYKNINCNSELYLIGNYEPYPDYYNSLKEMLITLPCRNNVFFTGKISDEELYAHYSSADLFVIMSEHEGFCIPLLEAMAFGIPVVAKDRCAVGDTMGGAGVLLESADEVQTAQLIHILLSDEITRNAIQISQSKRIEEFSKSNIRSKLRELLEMVQEK